VIALDRLLAEGRLTGSWLAAHATGARLFDGPLPIEPAVPCPMCGYRFHPGEGGHPNPTFGSKSFNDAYSMRGGATSPVCAACAVVVTNTSDFAQRWCRAIATRSGLYPAASTVDLAYWLKEPPAPPFVFVFGTTTVQHVFWRTPVAYSRDYFPVRVGAAVGMIRRHLLLQAYDKTPNFMEAIQARSGPQVRRRRVSSKPVSSHPFQRTDRDMTHPRHGLLKFEAAQLLELPDGAPFRFFTELNAFECWGLGALVGANAKPRSSAPRPVATPH
jgi:CRISPR type IV-associated protein Csf1